MTTKSVAALSSANKKAPSHVILLCLLVLLGATPMLIDASEEMTAVCIRNCAQCKKMFGPYFEGQLCAEACIKFKGKLVPECTDAASIAPFLNKLD